jgi:hypothetical protein
MPRGRPGSAQRVEDSFATPRGHHDQVRGALSSRLQDPLDDPSGPRRRLEHATRTRGQLELRHLGRVAYVKQRDRDAGIAHQRRGPRRIEDRRLGTRVVIDGHDDSAQADLAVLQRDESGSRVGNEQRHRSRALRQPLRDGGPDPAGQPDATLGRQHDQVGRMLVEVVQGGGQGAPAAHVHLLHADGQVLERLRARAPRLLEPPTLQRGAHGGKPRPLVLGQVVRTRVQDREAGLAKQCNGESVRKRVRTRFREVRGMKDGIDERSIEQRGSTQGRSPERLAVEPTTPRPPRAMRAASPRTRQAAMKIRSRKRCAKNPIGSRLQPMP